MAIGGKAGETFTEINVTPLTDVFLVLLVIMILIAPLVNQTVLKVDAPAPPGPKQAEQPKDKDSIDVFVSANGIIKVNGTPVSTESMAIQQAIHNEQLKAGTDDLPLQLGSDGLALQKHIVAVMDAASGAGIKRMRVMPLRN